MRAHSSTERGVKPTSATPAVASRASRNSSILALQQVAGNAAVSRLVLGREPRREVTVTDGGRRPPGFPAEGARARVSIQRMLGFEAEVDLGVSDNADRKIPGDAVLGSSLAKPSYTLVTDSRGHYSNMEFVSAPVSVVGSRKNAEAGLAEIRGIAANMRQVHDELHDKATERAMLWLKDSGITGKLALTALGESAKLLGKVNGNDVRGAKAADLFVQYSVGVPVSEMSIFFDYLRSADPSSRKEESLNVTSAIRPVSDMTRQARLRLEQARTFADGLLSEFDQWRGSDSKKRDRDDECGNALRGFSELVYTQLTAMADRAGDARKQLPKNYTSVLSRSGLHEVRAKLPQLVQDFLEAKVDMPDENDFEGENLFTKIFDKLQEAGIGEEPRNYDPGASMQAGQLREVTLAQYGRAAFKKGQAKAVDQQRVFGGMRTIPPHDEAGKTMVPMEIRRFGGPRKSWEQVNTDLTVLATWAQEAWAHPAPSTAAAEDDLGPPAARRPSGEPPVR